MKNAKIAAAIVLFAGLAAPAFSGDGERRISLQASPLPYINDIVYLFADSNVKTFNIAVDIEFQYAVSRHFNFSMAGALSFENYPSVYIQSGGGY
ncbi:MAG: hypothetical protein LBB77_02300 [Treponema sp.]|jgi:hypothetical protein|nr:hypothetical protein [Treponema sp.]